MLDLKSIEDFVNHPLVSAEEAERISEARSVKRRESFHLGRTVLRLLLADVLAADPSSIKVDVRDDGSLRLVDFPGRVSLSHSGNTAAAAYSLTNVGIDIEEVKPRRPDLYRYILHPDEFYLLEDLGLDANEATILCWTLKEAVLKGRRSGLRHSPKDIRLDLDILNGSGRAVLGDGDQWDLHFEQVGELYKSVAYQTATTDLK